MVKSEITDKVYYLIKDWDKTPGFISYEIVADLTSQYGDAEQFNEYVLRLMAELSADKLVEYFFDAKENETADEHFVPGKMIAAKYMWEREVKGLFFKRTDRYTSIHTISKDNEFLRYSSDFIQKNLGFEIKIYPYKDLDFSVNDPQTVVEYITSNDHMLCLWPEVENPVCNILINPKYITIEELIKILTDFTEKTGRKLEVNL